MLLTVANLDRMGPPRPKNPQRISIWVHEVSIACSQCSKPEPVVQAPKFWKRIFSREPSVVSSSTSLSKPGSKDTSKDSSSLSVGKRKSSTATATATATATSTAVLGMAIPTGTGDEMSRTAMYAPGLEGESSSNQWGNDEWENDNGESSLDMQSSESGVGWGARDRAQRLDRAERLLNTDWKKSKMAAMRQAAAVNS